MAASLGPGCPLQAVVASAGETQHLYTELRVVQVAYNAANGARTR